MEASIGYRRIEIRVVQGREIERLNHPNLHDISLRCDWEDVLHTNMLTAALSQPQPEAAISLIHKQPVRWTSSRTVSCDGGGGPLGHPRIFINVDKPQICWCTYCGLPFAHEHHRKHLQSLPSTTYPLEPVGEPAEVPQQQRISDEAFAQR